MNGLNELPVPFEGIPYWRVNFRPTSYEPERIASLSECQAIIERHQVRMRGWYYPHISHQPGQSGAGSNWIGNWSGGGGRHTEYWRFYQSAQFIHLFCVNEAVEKDWHQKLLTDTKGHLSHYRDLDLDSVPGFMSTVNILYTMSEIVEFATRLAVAGVYEGDFIVDVSLEGVKGFVLTTDWNRAWHEYYSVAESTIRRRKVINIEELISSPASVTQDWTEWIYQCFGWLNPSAEAIKKDIEEYRAGKY
ncbi:MAG: hypothetical protein AB2806_21580 [Candidatus Thiodiazotropha sp.]